MNEPNLQPTLEGPRVRIAPLERAHFEALYAVASDPLIWEQHPSSDRYQLPVFTALFDGGLASGGALIVRDAVTDEVIGSSRYYDWQPAAKSIAIGYTFLARRCWGGTYNRDMKRLMLGHAFTFADRVWFHVGRRNLRSRTAMQRIGAQFSHEVNADATWGHKDMAYFFIDRAAFQASPLFGVG